MLFNSFEFLIFLPIVFILYWFVFPKNRTAQNVLLLVSSYFFYGWWDWRFLSLLFISSLCDYFLGQKIHNSTSRSGKRWGLGLSLLVNLGILGFFKYYNFFVSSFIEAFASVGIELQASTLQIILPVGISFYTFQTLSYSIDIYRGRLTPTKDVVSFFAFVSFFPQLVAGPIERASHLLPQFQRDRNFSYRWGKDGLRQILWGLFKKVVIADNCAKVVDIAFADPANTHSSLLILGAVFFALQIYGDFSGYSDIAIGTARLFGFHLMQNFRVPYLSRDIGEFWRRWHISLSTWFRDYVYIPLGGNRKGLTRHFINLGITFVISGFWHGANWTFLAWGAVHALYYVLFMFIYWLPIPKPKSPEGLGLRLIFRGLMTFVLVDLAWILFRADDIGQAKTYIQGIFANFGDSFLVLSQTQVQPIATFCMWATVIMMLFEGANQTRRHSLILHRWPVWLRWPLYLVLMLAVLNFFGNEQAFIYFDF